MTHHWLPNSHPLASKRHQLAPKLARPYPVHADGDADMRVFQTVCQPSLSRIRKAVPVRRRCQPTRKLISGLDQEVEVEVEVEPKIPKQGGFGLLV